MDRMLRVNELLKRELGTILARRVSGDVDCLVTVTRIETSPDLHNATVYVSVYGSPEQRITVRDLLKRLRKDIQHDIAQHVRLKYTPVLKFMLDDSQEQADRVMKILDELGMDESDNATN